MAPERQAPHLVRWVEGFLSVADERRGQPFEEVLLAYLEAIRGDGRHTDWQVRQAADAVSRGGMTVPEFVSKAMVASATAHRLRHDHAGEGIQTGIDEVKKGADAAERRGQPEAAAGMRIAVAGMKLARGVTSRIPSETANAVRPHAAEIIRLARGAK